MRGSSFPIRTLLVLLLGAVVLLAGAPAARAATSSGGGSRTNKAGGGTTYLGRPVSCPSGIVTGSDGALWYTNSQTSGSGGAGNSIGRITTGGAISAFKGSKIK